MEAGDPIVQMLALMQQQMQLQQETFAQQQRQQAEAQRQQAEAHAQQQRQQAEAQRQQAEAHAQQLRQQAEAQRQQAEAQAQQLAILLEAINRRPPPQFHCFQPDSEEWSEYLESFEQHLLCHQVGDAKTKKAFFLSCVGNKVTSLLGKLLPDRDSSDWSWEEIKNKLDTYFNKTPHVLAARYKFFQCRKSEGQSHCEWITELAGLARQCHFKCPPSEGETSYAETLIRDMVVLHTPEDKIRFLALQNGDPSLEEIKTLCKTYETTRETARQITAGSCVCSVTDNNSVKDSSSDSINSLSSSVSTRTAREKISEARKGRQNNQIGAKSAKWGGDSRKTKSTNIFKAKKSCKGCGKYHSRAECRFRDAQCFYCKRMGHIQEVCEQKRHAARSARHEEDMEVAMVSEVISGEGQRKLTVQIKVGSQPVDFLLDTGAPVTLINLNTYRLLGSPGYAKVHKRLTSFGKTPIKVLGSVRVQASYKSKQAAIELLVVDRYDVTNILGLDSFDKLGFGVVDEVNQISDQDEVHVIKDLVSEFAEVFSPGLGECKGFQAKIQLREGHKPRFYKARPVPWALRDKVKEELTRLQKEGVITPVTVSQWATPLVLVKKSSGKIRLCGDFKSTVNQQVEVEQYPIPKPEDLFYKLSGGQQFSKIDLRDAYLQIPLDPAAKEVLVINTPLGLFSYNRLPFGVNSAAAIFQRCLEQITSGLDGCCNYLDDIIVTGRSLEDHTQNLRKLFTVLRDRGFKVNQEKCEFFKEKVVFLGHVLDSTGIAPTQQHVQAIIQMPPPTDLKQLQAFLGKVNYYNKFIRNFSTIAAPLNHLRKKGVRFVWSEDCNKAWNSLKQELLRTVRLNHFVPGRITTVAADASDYGLGAVLSQKDGKGIERPIAFMSKTLNKHQRNYSQVEKEALAIIFAVKKFNEFLYGTKFHIITDHKPLVQLFHPGKKIPESTAKKLQRWALFLADYDYQIHYRSTSQHANADALSRLPAGPDPVFDASEEECLQLDLEDLGNIADFPLEAKTIARETDKDPELNQVRRFIREGWPARRLRSNARWYGKQDRLSCKAGVLLLEGEEFTKVIIPKSLRQTVLKLLHQGHWGIVRTKQLARRHCMWPGMNSDIEQMLKSCEACQLNQSAPPKDLTPWPEPTEPWERVHVDFAGPFWGSMWLVVVDAKSNYPYVVEMGSTTSAQTVEMLERIFVTEGLPVVLISDNGPQFSSQEFAKFCASNGIHHICAPPFHPQSNGEAERFVRTFKTAMGKARAAGTPKSRALLRVLATYRVLPGSTGKSPAEVLHGRQPRTLLSLLSPSDPHTAGGIRPKYKVGDKVYIQSLKKEPAWVPGIVQEIRGSRVYAVRTLERLVTRHQGQIRPRTNESQVDGRPWISPEEFRRKVMKEIIYVPQERTAVGTPTVAADTREEAATSSSREPACSSRTELRPRRVTRSVRFAPYATHFGAEGAVAEQAPLKLPPVDGTDTAQESALSDSAAVPSRSSRQRRARAHPYQRVGQRSFAASEL